MIQLVLLLVAYNLLVLTAVCLAQQKGGRTAVPDVPALRTAPGVSILRTAPDVPILRTAPMLPPQPQIAPSALQKNPFHKFGRVYYINLDKRTDRRNQMEDELAKAGVYDAQRVPGIIDRFGALGCSKAHLAVLKDCLAHGYSSCLVLEDDFMFTESPHEKLEAFWASGEPWDVLMLGGYVARSTPGPIQNLVRVQDAQTTSAYAVNAPFLRMMIENYRAGIASLERLTAPDYWSCLDIYWKKLQPGSQWYAFEPRLGVQRESYSDIEGRVVAYGV